MMKTEQQEAAYNAAYESYKKSVEAFDNWSEAYDIEAKEYAERRALHDPAEVLRTFEAWLERGRLLIQKAKKIQWEIGDWLREGDNIGGERNEFLVLPEGRDLIAEVAARTDYDADSLRDFRRVARAFPYPETRHLVSWSHHQAVAAIEDEEKREELLDQAACNGTSLADLRRAVRLYNTDANPRTPNLYRPHFDGRVLLYAKTAGVTPDVVVRAAVDSWFYYGYGETWMRENYGRSVKSFKRKTKWRRRR